MRSARTALFIAFSCLLAAPVFAQTTGETCSAGNATYTLSLSGRAISSAGSFAGAYQGIGIVTVTASGNITMTGTYNTNLVTGKSFTYSGTFTTFVELHWHGYTHQRKHGHIYDCDLE